MEITVERRRGEKGLTPRQLVLLFLAGVAVCAVFFSLGFLVGFNEHASKAAVTEQVTTPGVIPPPVNPPLGLLPSTGKAAASRASAAGQPLTGSPEQVSAEDISEPKSVTPPIPSSTQPVRGAASSPASAGSSNPTPPSGQEVTPGFTVQVAATTNRQDAEAVVTRLKVRGYPVFLVTPEYAHADDNLFRVQVGPYTLREDAEKARQKLAQEGFKQPFIRH